MIDSLSRQHIQRVWKQHWALQLATVTVMTAVLMLFNLLAAGVQGAERLMYSWGQGLEMVVYVKDTATPEETAAVQKELEASRKFSQVHFTSKQDATEAFMKTLGKDSVALVKDPQWRSPLPASFEAKLNESFAAESALEELKSWSTALTQMNGVDDVFYGQGWIENFSHFFRQAKIAVIGVWALALLIGLLIVGNCIRLSFLRRKEEIEVLELVGATSRFIRKPFVLEGMFLGVVASVISLGLSFGLHAVTLTYFKTNWTFWSEWSSIRPMEPWMIGMNLLLGIGFGAVGAWLCVRKLNTGWSAVGGR
jgi:cell division transport system permease protein